MYNTKSDSEVDVPVYWRKDLGPGTRLKGPSVIVEDAATTYVSATFDAHINAGGYIVLERRQERGGTAA